MCNTIVYPTHVLHVYMFITYVFATHVIHQYLYTCTTPNNIIDLNEYS